MNTNRQKHVEQIVNNLAHLRVEIGKLIDESLACGDDARVESLDIAIDSIEQAERELSEELN